MLHNRTPDIATAAAAAAAAARYCIIQTGCGSQHALRHNKQISLVRVDRWRGRLATDQPLRRPTRKLLTM